MTVRKPFEPSAFKNIHSMMAREILVRFSADPVGYFWAILTPLIWVLSIAIVFQLLGRLAPIDTDIFSFLIAGMMPYTIFRTTISNMMRSERAHQHMISINGITSTQVHIAAGLMEFVNGIIVFTVLLIGNFIFLGNFEVDDPLLVFVGFFCAWGLGFSFGKAASCIARDHDMAYRVVPIILRPMFWISGIFFVANELPAHAHKFLQYNPLLQSIEIVRSGMFKGYEYRQSDLIIPVIGVSIFLLLSVTYNAAMQRAAGVRLLHNQKRTF